MREKAHKYYEEGAKGGHVHSRHNLGVVAYENCDYIVAMRHWRLSASGGFKLSIRALIERFEDGLLHHGDLAETLQSAYCARAEMKSNGRDLYIEYLKSIGEYEERLEF